MTAATQKYQSDISELSLIIQEHNVRMYDTTVSDKYEIINSILETLTSNNAFFIVDLNEIVRKYNSWKKNLPMVKAFYAVKCNPNAVLIRLMTALGIGFDCASKNEIGLVRSLGAKPENIIYANPCKEYSQIQYARANDVDLLTFDGENELYKVKLYHPCAKLLLRIQTDDSFSKCRFNSKFGADRETALSLLELGKKLHLNIVGISFHVGSGCSSDIPYRQAISLARDIFTEAAKMGMRMNILDIGGGFSGTNEELFEKISTAIVEELESFSDIPNLEVIAEPGRYFVETSHTLVVNVIDKKQFTDHEDKIRFKYYINDGVYGSFNCTIFDHAKPNIQPYNERDGARYDSIVFGPTCDSMDTITTEAKLPELAIGEWCFVENFGAYTTAASTTFNGLNQTHCVYILTYS